MMNSEDQALFSVVIDGAWKRLPTASGDHERQIDAVIAELGVDGSAAARLNYGLHAVAHVAGNLSAGERHSFALIREPSTGVVDALLSTRVSRVEDGALDGYRARVGENRPGEQHVSSVNRTVEERRLPQGLAVIVHDITLREDGDGLVDPALERVILALFVSSADVLIEFYLATQNLALFDDAVDYLVELVAGDPTDAKEDIR
jgi:hypothetical protein